MAIINSNTQNKTTTEKNKTINKPYLQPRKKGRHNKPKKNPQYKQAKPFKAIETKGSIMKNGKKSEHQWLLTPLSWVMTFVFLVAIFSVFWSIFTMLLFPTGEEYVGRFPSDPPFLSDQFLTNMTHGILRHISLLPEHITASSLVGIVGQAFATMLIYSVREKVYEIREKKGEILIDDYVKWGFGSIIAAIIAMASSIGGILNRAYIVFILSICAFVLYVVYPRFGILITFKNWIQGKIQAREPLGMLGLRLTKGEITIEEYKKVKKVIQEKTKKEVRANTLQESTNHP